MTECEYTDRLSAYFDGELDSVTSRRLEQHLLHCPACSAELESIRRISGLLAGMPKPQMSPQTLHRLHASVEAASPVRRLATELVAMAATILIVCGISLWRLPQANESAGPMPVWEASLLQRPAEAAPSNSEDQLASWMAEDLSRENGQ